MVTSADIALLFRVSELVRRFGLKPSEAEATLELVMKNDNDLGHFELSFDGILTEKLANFEKMMVALGGGMHTKLRTSTLSEMEDIVDRAISLAPRANGR